MTRAGTTLTIAAIGLWSMGVFGQGRNFDGSWVVDTEKTAAANAAVFGAGGGGGGGMRSGGGGAVGGAVVSGGGGGRGGGGGGGSAVGGGAVARSGGGGGGRGGAAAPTVISLEGATFTVGAGENRIAYKLDGSATTIERPNGTVTAKASWVGDKLTIQSVTDTANGQVTSTTVWYLEGESLVRETSAPGPDGQTTTRKTYFKRG